MIKEKTTPIINYKKGIAPYIQIKDYLNDKIVNGEWQPGHQIPPESKLVKDFGVSRMTIRRAISELVIEGKLETKQGSGTFVTEPLLESNF
ncbi:MAG: GntR family transcriptional regulator, partial [Dehalobacterium sp.]